jgi:hypothetical protein
MTGYVGLIRVREVAKQNTLSKRFGSRPVFSKLGLSLWVSDSRPSGFRIRVMGFMLLIYRTELRRVAYR